MPHAHKTYAFYLGYALAAEKARNPIKAAYWLTKALQTSTI